MSALRPGPRPLARRTAVIIAVGALPLCLVAYFLDAFLPQRVLAPLALISLLAWAPWGIAVLFSVARKEPKAWLALLTAPLLVAPYLAVAAIVRAQECGAGC